MASNKKTAPKIAGALVTFTLAMPAVAQQFPNLSDAEPRWPAVPAEELIGGPQWPNVPREKLGPAKPALVVEAPRQERARAAAAPSATAEDNIVTASVPRAPMWPAVPHRAPMIMPVPDKGPAFFTYEVGGRYWYGFGKTAKNLYGFTESDLVSRLTYTDVQTHTLEALARADHSSGHFIKGYVGAGAIGKGSLYDEDFPGVFTYSNTISGQQNGKMTYASADIGSTIVKGGDFRVGAFLGYHYLFEQVNAYGCTQLASDSVCTPSIANSILVISQDNNWHSFRVGLEGHFDINDRWRVSVDAAWLPYVKLVGADTHWLRVGTSFTGPVPEDGKGWGYQLEGSLSYRINQSLSVGAGGRYWRMQSKGNTHFEGHLVSGGGWPQPVHWQTDHYGVFLQANLKIGPYEAFWR